MCNVPRLRGVFPMLPTPFDEEGRIVWNDLDRVITFEMEQGVHGIAALGLGGEAAFLTESERLAVAEYVLSRVEGDLPTIIGATAQDTAASCRLARHAVEHGATAVMVAPPSLPDADRSTLKQHYLEVATAASPAPLMVQDAPAYVGVSLDVEFVCDLAREQPNVKYAKSEAVPAGQRTAELVQAGVKDLEVFGGNSALYYLDVLDAGAVGIMPGCECPREYVSIFEDYSAGRREEAAALFRHILPLLVFEIQSLSFFLACSKELLRKRGLLSSSALRSPCSMTPWSLDALRMHARSALDLVW